MLSAIGLALALVATPLRAGCEISSPRSVPAMSIISRRAVLALPVAAMSPMAANAADLVNVQANLNKDKELLTLQERVVQALEKTIGNLRKAEQKDEAEMKKDEAAFVAAVESGDVEKEKELRAEIDALAAKIEGEKQRLKSLVKEDQKEKAIEKEQLLRVQSEESVLSAAASEKESAEEVDSSAVM